MRKVSFVIGLCLILALVLNVMAIQRSHPDIMRDISSTRGSLQRNIEAGNGEAAAADAEKLEGFFKELPPIYETIQFFTRTSNMESAIEMANETAAAAAEAAMAAKAGDMDKAMAAHGNIREGCRGCHGQYREKAPDGSNRIKRPGG